MSLLAKAYRKMILSAIGLLYLVPHDDAIAASLSCARSWQTFLEQRPSKIRFNLAGGYFLRGIEGKTWGQVHYIPSSRPLSRA